MLQILTRLLLQKTKRNRLCVRFLSDGVENEAAKNGPLSGVRILDFSRILAGPFCTMLLGDLGAEIIKIENPRTGDETRGFGPPHVKGETTWFLASNRNKKSITLDLKHSKGRELAKELAMKSDVLVENFMPGKMASFGLDYDDLKSIAPGLIYCSITGFGPSGPYNRRPGVDLIAASLGGLIHVTGPKDGDPCTVGIPMTDIATGLYAHGAIMAALLERNRTKKGQRIDCDLLASQISILTHVGLGYLNAGVEPVRMGSSIDTIVPYQAYKTKDGYVVIACISNKTIQNLCEILELPDLTADPKFSSMSNRLENRDDMDNILQNVFVTNTTDHWLKKLEGSHVLYGSVNNMERVFKDPQVVHKKLIQDVNHSTIGKTKMIGPAVTYSHSSNKIRSAPPTLGEHTDSVLADVLSYSPKKIQKLRDAKVLG